MTTTELDAHLRFIKQRDAIIAAAQRNQPATHQTTRNTWHGCPIAEGTPLIASAELQALFDSEYPDTTTARWFIIANSPAGHICQLWPHEAKPI